MNRETEILQQLEFILSLAENSNNTLLKNKIEEVKESIEEYFLESYNAEKEIIKILND